MDIYVGDVTVEKTQRYSYLSGNPSHRYRHPWHTLAEKRRTLWGVGLLVLFHQFSNR